jgi:formiminotetrahydrofolate cyclodeaminase
MDSAFMKALARARPDPGGGAAAAHAAALGLALLEKVVRLEHRRPIPEKPPGVPWDHLLRRVHTVADALARLQDEDVEAYRQLARACKTDASPELAPALEEALACPLRIMQQSQEGICLVLRVGSQCQLHLLADLLVASELLIAAVRGAHHIARANLQLMDPNPRQAFWAKDLAHTLFAIEAEFQRLQGELLGRA